MEWFEHEDFWVNFGPIMFDEQRWAEASSVAESVKNLCGLSENDTIIDCGCGPGRISVELALLGLKVTGVDLIKPLLDAATESANAEGVSLNLIQSDLRNFTSEQKYDAAVNLYTSFGYCDTIDEDIQILRRIADTVKDGGTFVMECLSREIAVRDFTEGEWFYRAGKTVLTEFSVQGAWEGLLSHWILIDNKTGERVDHSFVQRLYSAVELKRILLNLGYKTCDIYGDFDMSTYNEKARTMVLVCRK